MKFLITWKLSLDKKALETIYEQPAFFKTAVEEGLKFVKKLAENGKITALYRILPTESPLVDTANLQLKLKPAKTRSGKMRGRLDQAESRETSGIAIVEAKSLIEAKRTVGEMRTLAPSGAVISTYVEYEIKALEEIVLTPS